MRIWIAVMVVVGVGCKNHDTMFGIEPGGGGGVGGGVVDASIAFDAHDGGTVFLQGIACVLADLRTLGPCATTGAGGLVVQLGTQLATTADNGVFAIALPLATNLVWRVSGTTIETSLVSFNALATIPVIPAAPFADLELANGILEVAGQGSLVAHVVHGGAFVASATATTNPSAAYAPLYDGSTLSAWTQSSTSVHGAVWVAGLPTGTVSLTITPPANGTPQVVSGIPIGDGSITFVTVELP